MNITMLNISDLNNIKKTIIVVSFEGPERSKSKK